MSKKTVSMSLLLAGLMTLSGFASAQTPVSSEAADKGAKGQVNVGVSDKTRAEVKAEAAATNTAMTKPKRGENRDVLVKPSTAGKAKTRAEVKAEAVAANKMVPKPKTGQTKNQEQGTAAPMVTGEAKTRAEVKSEIVPAK